MMNTLSFLCRGPLPPVAIRSLATLTLGLLLLGACSKQKGMTDDGDGTDLAPAADMRAGGKDMGGGGTGLPCGIEATLQDDCQSCHGSPPKPGPISLLTYEDLVAPSKIDPRQKVVERCVVRMRDAKSPMPPKGTVPEEEIAAFEAWVKAGTPRTTCVPSMDMNPSGDMKVVDMNSGDMTGPRDMNGGDMAAPTDMNGGDMKPVDMSSDLIAPADMGGPADMAVVCSSGRYWILGDIGSSNMHPGHACITCHRARGAPNLTLAGTVYPTAHEPDDCAGPSGAVIQITDAAGKVISMTANNNGNFRSSTSFTAPYTATVTYMGRTRSMMSAQTSGDCNACHTQAGASGAPGRVLLP